MQRAPWVALMVHGQSFRSVLTAGGVALMLLRGLLQVCPPGAAKHGEGGQLYPTPRGPWWGREHLKGQHPWGRQLSIYILTCMNILRYIQIYE